MKGMEAPRTGAHEGLNVLALNSGSSSIKFGLYWAGPSGAEALLTGEADVAGDDARRKAISDIGRRLAQADLPPPDAIGHRIVHGGPNLRRHCLIDDRVLRELRAAAPFAPLHTPAVLSVIRFARKHFPGLPQAACFDTAFHAGLPPVARVLPIPKALQAWGIQRYGFHGLSCESIVRQLGADLPDKLVIAHLGAGAGVTAAKGGRSIDTSMGLTPTGGVIMGTRSGDIDPGVLVYLMREKGYNGRMLEDLVDHRSGLMGISDVSSDMRRLREAAASNPDARLAIQMFCYSVRKQIGAMIAALDGADMIVFTGGIGENDPEARAEICAGLSWIGVELEANPHPSVASFAAAPRRCSVRVLPSREDEQIARHTWELTLQSRGIRRVI